MRLLHCLKDIHKHSVTWHLLDAVSKALFCSCSFSTCTCSPHWLSVLHCLCSHFRSWSPCSTQSSVRPPLSPILMDWFSDPVSEIQAEFQIILYRNNSVKLETPVNLFISYLRIWPSDLIYLKKNRDNALFVTFHPCFSTECPTRRLEVHWVSDIYIQKFDLLTRGHTTWYENKWGTKARAISESRQVNFPYKLAACSRTSTRSCDW